MVQRLGGRVIEVFSDSKLVVDQVMGELEARDARMQEYLGQVKRLQTSFESFNLTHISRNVNTHADTCWVICQQNKTKVRIECNNVDGLIKGCKNGLPSQGPS